MPIFLSKESGTFVRSNGDTPIAFKLTNVKDSPCVSQNLLSLCKFVESGFVVQLTQKDLKIVDSMSGKTF